MEIGIYSRVGIEVELRTYSLKGQIRNKSVLAETPSKITDRDLNIPYLKLVSEGSSTGTSYFELVFGAVEYSNLYQVKGIVEIAKQISDCKNITDWVNKFNDAIRKRTSQDELLNFVLKLQAGSNSINIKETFFETVSIQANILIPVDSFADRDKVNRIFSGTSVIEFPYISLFESIDKYKLTKVIKGAIFIAVYVCSIYSLRRLKLNDNIAKQNFPLLFKVELTTLLKELVPVTIIDELNAEGELFDKISSNLFWGTSSNIFKENIIMLAENVRQEHPYFKITPRSEGVLPMYWSREKVCIVMELRKGKCTLLNKIAEYLDSKILSKPVKPQITKPVKPQITKPVKRQTTKPVNSSTRQIVRQYARSIVTRSVNIPELSVLWN